MSLSIIYKTGVVNKIYHFYFEMDIFVIKLKKLIKCFSGHLPCNHNFLYIYSIYIEDIPHTVNCGLLRYYS